MYVYSHSVAMQMVSMHKHTVKHVFPTLSKSWKNPYKTADIGWEGLLGGYLACPNKTLYIKL